MRVLVVSPQLFPLDHGGAQRSHALIAALAERHEVMLSAPLDIGLRPAAETMYSGIVSRFFWVDPAKARARSIPTDRGRLTRLRRYVVDVLTQRYPFAFRPVSSEWQMALDKELPDIDAVLCRHTVLYPLVARAGARKIVLDADDLAFVVQWNQVKGRGRGFGAVFFVIEVLRTFAVEQWIAFRAAQVLVTSTGDARRVATHAKTIIANGVTFEDGPRQREPESGTVVFVGHCGYGPNADGLEWFIRSVWPSVRAAHPSARLNVVGRQANVGMLPFAVGPGITLAENVPSVRPWFESAVVSVVPLFHGAGTRIKIVESLGYGTPVIATPVGAAGIMDMLGEAEGLQVVPDAATMIQALSRVLANSSRMRDGAQRGQEIVRSRLTWHATTRPLVEGFAGWVG